MKIYINGDTESQLFITNKDIKKELITNLTIKECENSI